MHFHGPIFYSLSEKNILLMNHASIAVVKNDHKRAFLHFNFFYKHPRALLHDNFAHHLLQGKEKRSTSAWSFNSKSQETRVICYSSLSVLVSTMRPFDYNARDESKKVGEKT